MKLFRPARSPNPDVTLMILPLPRSSMCGITAREQYIAPVRFVSIPTRPSSLNLSRTATVHAFRTSYLVRPNSTSALRPPTSYFLLLISEPRVAPFQRRLQPLLLLLLVGLGHHRR